MNKRDAILERLADFVLAEGVEAATLRTMAAAAGLSDRMLLYYFKDKDEILTALLAELSERFEAALDSQRMEKALRKDALHTALDAVVLDDALWPLLRLRLELATKVARQEAPFAAAGHAMAGAFHQWIEGQLVTANPELRRAEATEIMIGLEGVVVLKCLDMGDLVAELV